MKKLLPLCFIALVITGTSCKKGYFTDEDQYDVRDEYISSYSVKDVYDASTSTYTIDIRKDDYTNDEIIFGFPGLFEAGMDVHAIVTGMKLIIPIQDFYISDYPEIFYEFTGSGSLEDSVLTVTYKVLTIQNGLIMDENNCVATMYKLN